MAGLEVILRLGFRPRLQLQIAGIIGCAAQRQLDYVIRRGRKYP